MKARLLALALLAGCVTQTTEGGGGDTGIQTDRPDITTSDGVSPTDAAKPLPDLPVVDECGDDSDCDDGLFCNGAEQCNPVALGAGPDGCLAGEAPLPEDPNLRDCVVPSLCNEDTDSFDTVVLSEGDACDDGIACTRDDACSAGGSCVGTPHDPRCDDGLFCNGLERCSALVGCVQGPLPEPVDADPGDCLVPGTCDESVDGYPLVPAVVGRDCNDGIACTLLDACTSAGTCAGQPSDSECSDGVFCNGAELCTVGVGCGPGVPGPGPDPDPTDCLVSGTCDEALGEWTWVPVPATTACDDGVVCTDDDVCDAAGACAGTPLHELCDDGVFCNGAERCAPAESSSASGCVEGEAPEPPADDTPGDCWIVGVCDEATQSFPLVPLAETTPCDDGVECTEGDACDALGGCVGAPSDAQCDDGAVCNGVETCGAAGCEAGVALTPEADPNADDCWVWSLCGEAEPHFELVPAELGALCDDAVSCTTGDACDAAGACAGSPNNSLCDDLLYCNGAELCDATGGCQLGAPPEPPALLECQTDTTCDETTQSFLPVPAEDGTSCGASASCQSGVCVPL